MTRLLYVPILHAEKEVGVLRGTQERPETTSPLREMWAGIQQKLEALKPVWEKVRIYQEALPVCGKEEKIVQDLAEKGSRNHRLLVDLIKKEAHLEGTEDPNLLLKEYDLLSRLFQNGDNPADRAEYRGQSEVILKERDQFIASRLRGTLKAGETGLVFIGVRHKLDQLLKKDFEIIYVIYRVPFEVVKTVYNL